MNLGVRQLGSIYEALLEYSVNQAETDLMVYRDSSSSKDGLSILDASFASDLQAKPKSFIPAGEIYLTVGGLARKGTGSYYTPDEIVRYLVKEGLKPHFQRREVLFRQDMEKLRATKGTRSGAGAEDHRGPSGTGGGGPGHGQRPLPGGGSQ